jgi:2-polyprenyl-3-methyl-5-hydroxy-6-metoxy-1,4-benzoquinol methylase
MKRKLEVLFLVVLMGVALASLVLTTGPGKRTELSIYQTHSPGSLLEKKETTVRNVTNDTVTYTIKWADGSEKMQERSLKVGEIDRIMTLRPLEIIFTRTGRSESFELTAGSPYSFRYDEDDLLQIYDGSHGRDDAVDLAPYVTTPMNVVEKMLEMAEVDKEDVIFDIGCGDGRIVITAAKNFGAKGVGIDIDPQRIEESRAGALEAGVAYLVEFRLGDATKMDLTTATVVTMFLLPESNALLIPLLDKLRPGAYIVSHNYSIPGWEHKEVESVDIADITGKNHSIFLYRK